MTTKINPTSIRNYISTLKDEINNNLNLKYVLLRLDNSNVNKLDKLLQDKSVINYIFNNYHQESPIVDEEGNNWSLVITGFKHGAKKNSPRKLGLIAYRSGYPINFKTMVFYDSDTINKYDYSAEGKKGVIQFIESSINKYLENTNNYNSNVNYIKPDRKSKK